MKFKIIKELNLGGKEDIEFNDLYTMICWYQTTNNIKDITKVKISYRMHKIFTNRAIYMITYNERILDNFFIEP